MKDDPKVQFKTAEEVAEWETQLKKLTAPQPVKESCDQADEYIYKDLAVCGSIPIHLTRTSPFFLMNKRQMKDRSHEKLTWETSWGKISMEGKRLSVYDETVLLSLFLLAIRHETETFITTKYELCKLTNVTPCKNTYNAIWESIKRLSKTSIDLEVKEHGELVFEMTGAMIAFAGRDHKTDKLKVILNPYFMEVYARPFVTGIDLNFRATLKSDTAKALYRFYEGQKNFKEKGSYNIALKKLAEAVNLSTDQALYHLRHQVRTALRELKAKRYLSKWQVTKNDIVMVWNSRKKKLV